MEKEMNQESRQIKCYAIVWTFFIFFRQQCTAEKMGMRRWAKCKNVRKEKYEEENGCSGEDELRKVSVQLSVLNKSR